MKSFLLVFCMVGLIVSNPTQADESDEYTDLNRIQNTLAYRLELARQWVEEGDLAEAAKLYDDLIAQFESTDPLAGETWLRAAALQRKLGNRDKAITLYREVLLQFDHIRWATQEAKIKLAELGADLGDQPKPARRKQSKNRNPIWNRTIVLDLQDAPLNEIQRIFQQTYEVPLDVDPALDDKTVTLQAKDVPMEKALALIAKEIGAELKTTSKGYRLLATTTPIKSITQSPTQKVQTTGKLSREEITKVIRANLRAIQQCYEVNLSENPSLKGKIEVVWFITPSGSVERVSIPVDTTREPRLTSCIEKLILTWQFPKPRGDGEVKVRYPFVFNSIGF